MTTRRSPKTANSAASAPRGDGSGDGSSGSTSIEVLHEGKRLRFEQWTTLRPGERAIVQDVVRAPGAVVVAPVLDDGSLVLIRNHRRVIGRALLEFCAGMLERHEDPAQGAARELVEETGYEAASIEFLARFYTSPGFCDEEMHVYRATGLRHVGQRLEADEEIEVLSRSAAELWSMVERGELVDGKTIAALALHARMGSGSAG